MLVKVELMFSPFHPVAIQSGRFGSGWHGALLGLAAWIGRMSNALKAGSLLEPRPTTPLNSIAAGGRPAGRDPQMRKNFPQSVGIPQNINKKHTRFSAIGPLQVLDSKGAILVPNSQCGEGCL